MLPVDFPPAGRGNGPETLQLTPGAYEVLEAPAPAATPAPASPPTSPRPALLIKFTHGLGDCVQLQVVLRHLRECWPDWDVDVLIGRGKGAAVRGLCRAVFEKGVGDPPAGPYDRVENLGWYENYNRDPSLPQTKPTNCLKEVFGINPRLELFRYSLTPTEEQQLAAEEYLTAVSTSWRRKVLILHYQGNTSETRKNLPHEVAAAVCTFARRCGWCVVILDWDGRTPLVDNRHVFNPGAAHPMWGGTGTGDAGMVAALIQQADLFIGVDSGPLHVAVGCPQTPAIGVWLEHSPVQFCDLGEHVTHLVPEDWRQRPPVNGDGEVSAFMAGRYVLKQYGVANGLHPGAGRALVEELAIRSDASIAAPDNGLLAWGGWWLHADNIYQDLIVVQDVYDRDSYQTKHFPSNVGPGEIVVDIGAHIGAFARLWHEKNRRATIVCVEVCPENIPALLANVSAFAEVRQAACTYEIGPMALLNACFNNCESTGGSTVVLDTAEPLLAPQDRGRYLEDRRPITKVTLEEILESLQVNRIDLLKLDCEGSEYSILQHSPAVHDGRVRAIVGEYHGVDRWNEFRARVLPGWDYGHMYEHGECGIFHLRSPHPAPAPTPASIPRCPST
jgi:FkbM family methyltransferase